MSRYISCRKCGGDGECTTCGGSGEIDATTDIGRFLSLGLVTHTNPCTRYCGDGKCNTCDGSGQELINKK